MENKEKRDLIEVVVSRYRDLPRIMKFLFFIALTKLVLALGFRKWWLAGICAGEICLILALPKDEFEKKIELIAQDLKEILKQRGLAPN